MVKMDAAPIDAVLSLSLAERGREERLHLLAGCLVRYVAPKTLRELNVVCGPGEGAAALDLLSKYPFTFSAKVVESQDLLGERHSEPWLRQQLAKLAVAAYATDFYLSLDANALLCGPLRLDDLVKNGKGRARLYGRGRHAEQYGVAERLLNGDRNVVSNEQDAMGVGSQVFSRHVVLQLQKRLQDRHGRPWMDVLCGAPGWLVPSLYWVAAKLVHADERFHYACRDDGPDCFSAAAFERWTPRFDPARFAIVTGDGIEPNRIQKRLHEGGILTKALRPGGTSRSTKVVVPYFRSEELGDYDWLLKLWEAFYVSSGSTLPICLLTDGKTAPPSWWKHEVAFFAEAPIELRNWGQKTDWLKANAFAACGRSLVLDADCLVLSPLDEIGLYEAEFLMSVSRRRWWGYGGNRRLHQCGVMLVGSSAPADFLRRKWSDAQYASQTNAENHGEMILADYFESLSQEPLPIEWNTEVFRLGERSAFAPGRSLLDRVALPSDTKVAHFSSYEAKKELKALDDVSRIRPRLQRLAYRSPQPFVIVANGRDGSTLLQSSLDAHPEVDCQEEMLSLYEQPKWWREAPSAAAYLTLKVFHRNFKPNVKAVGFKLLSYQGRESPVADARDYLRSIGAKAILVERRNRVRHYVSYRLAHESAVWHSRDGQEARTETILVKPKEALRELRASDEAYARSRQEFADVPHLLLYYEDLAAHFDETLHRACGFLGVEPIQLPQRVHKLERRSLREIVRNFDELQRELAETPYQAMLESDAS